MVAANTVALSDLYHQGVVFSRQKQTDAALRCFEEAIRLAPTQADCHNARGVMLLLNERYAAAVECFQETLRLQPNHVGAYVNLGNAFFEMGQRADAMRSFVEALRLDSNSAEAWVGIGNIFADLDQTDDARVAYENAAAFNPDLPQVEFQLGKLAERWEDFRGAAKHFERAIQLDPQQHLRRLRILTMCPSVFQSVADIEAYRERLLKGIRQFPKLTAPVDLATAAAYISEPPFPLMYQGRDDREIKDAYADLLVGGFPSDPPTPRRDGHRPQIGFVVTRRHERAFSRCLGPLVARLDRRLFDVTVVVPEQGLNSLHQSLGNETVRLVAAPRQLDRLADVIRELRCDLLYHWEVGSDATNYLLPFLRLAPVQVTSFGIPVTSGNPRIDAYLSSELLEDDDSDRFYRERLIRMKTLPCYQTRAKLVGTRRREDFGFDSSSHIYFCPQSLHKVQPTFDFLLGEILRRDESGLVVFLAERQGPAVEKLQSRFSAAMPDVKNRIRFLPRLPYADYLHLLAVSDVVLDTTHYCGMTTTYDAFSLNKAIVTWPSSFQRGRYTAACYRQMGLPDCVAGSAEDYVRQAVALGTDEAFRRHLEERIAAASDVLFDDLECVREYERLFLQMTWGTFPTCPEFHGHVGNVPHAT